MANLNDFAERFRLGHTSASPFSSFGLEWCPRCKMEVDCDTAARHDGHTYAYRRWCLRCGIVIKRGVYDNVVILSGNPLPPAALEWSLEPGKDRR